MRGRQQRCPARRRQLLRAPLRPFPVSSPSPILNMPGPIRDPDCGCINNPIISHEGFEKAAFRDALRWRVHDRSCDPARSDPLCRASIHGREGQTRNPKHETPNKFKARSPEASNPPRYAWAGLSCARWPPCLELGFWVIRACFGLRFSCFGGVPRRAAQKRSCTRAWSVPFGACEISE